VELVTASDSRYFRTLQQFLASVRRVQPELEITVWDLGLSPDQRASLTCRVRTFPFGQHPPHVGVLSAYGWKPLCLQAMAPGPVLWLDAGTLLKHRLGRVARALETVGIYTMVGQSPQERWCRTEVFDALAVPAEVRRELVRVGCVLGLDTSRPRVAAFLDDWTRLCLQESLLMPEGHSRRDHRYDQSLLNIALARSDLELVVEDEVDISSGRPADFLSTRNFVRPGAPLWTDPIYRAWSATWKAVDQAAHRWRS